MVTRSYYFIPLDAASFLFFIIHFLNMLSFNSNEFQSDVPFLHSLEASENLRFSDILRGYRNRTLT